MPFAAPIIVTNWYPAAHFDFYIGDKTKQETTGIGDTLDLHQYYWMNEYKKQLQKEDSAYYIIPSNLFDYKAFSKVTDRFTNFTASVTIDLYRNGILCKHVYVFRMKGYKG